jgi:NADH dehydrogenase [ubiquinone] 1 alpha subcomplex assembly factor 5
MDARPGPPAPLFDPARVARARARADTAACAPLLGWLGREVAERLADIRRDFPLALATDDRVPVASPKVGRWVTLPRNAVAAPGALPFARAFDLVVSALALHTVDDLPGALSAIRGALKPGGVLLAAIPGPGSLRAFRQALIDAERALGRAPAPRLAPLPTAAQVAGLMGRAGLALPVVDTARLRATYADISALMAELRALGERTPLARVAPAPRRLFEVAQRLHPKEPGTGRVEAVFEITLAIGWAGLRGPTQRAQRSTL